MQSSAPPGNGLRDAALARSSMAVTRKERQAQARAQDAEEDLLDHWGGWLLVHLGRAMCPRDVAVRKAFRRVMSPNQQHHVARTLKLQIIVAGLLTTSTYPAVFLPLDPSDALQGSVGVSLGRWAAQLFRMFNAVSFASSLMVISSSFCLSFSFNLCTSVPPTPGSTMSRKSLELKDWAVGLVYLLYMSGWWGMSITIGSALLALLSGLYRFNSWEYATPAFVVVLILAFATLGAYAAVSVASHGNMDRSAPSRKGSFQTKRSHGFRRLFSLQQLPEEDEEDSGDCSPV